MYSSLISPMSFSFSFESKISLTFARLAASILSLIPPTGSTFPRSVISPVMASFAFTFRWVKADANAVSMVTPADGPSFGVAPSGT